jgi:hypothetical protein
VIELGTCIPDGGYRAVMVKIVADRLTMEHIELSGLRSGQAHVNYSTENGMTDVTFGFLQSGTVNMPIGAAKENGANSSTVSDAERLNATDVATRVCTTIRPVVDQHWQDHRARR